MADRRVPRGRSHRMTVLVAVVMVVLLAEAGLVAAVFVSPSTGDSLRGVVARVERAWTGTDESPGLRSRVADTAKSTYDDWIRPLWAAPDRPQPDRGFERCTSCHPDYAAKRRFTSVFMNHPLHEEIGAECGDCHTENAHPSPLRPEERTCAECHREVREQGSCGLCHPPSSLPHFYLLGAPRDGVVNCDACHPKGSFDTLATEPLVHRGTFDGTDREACLSCHENTSCESCHGEPHPSDWISTHGGEVGYGGPSTCALCHTATWCADRCHSSTSTNPGSSRPYPTPTGGLP